MATIANREARRKPLTPDRFERFLAGGAVVLLVAVVIALMRGQHEWHLIEPNLWAHLGTMVVALGLTPVMLLRPRGDARHRMLGRIWVTAMFLTALVSLTIRDTNDGGFSLIHILSAWTLLQVPLIYWSARTRNIERHRGSVRGMVLGALLIAGFFTFPFDRLLGHWLFA